MLSVDRKTGTLALLSRTTLSNAGLGERSGLQELILKNSDAFFEECQETLFLIKEEVEPSDQVSSRIDLLAIDTKGWAVIIELKRGSDKLQLLQSLTYAAMISDWTEEEFKEHLPAASIASYQAFKAKHGLSSLPKLNESQRLILVAESYDFEVLKTAQWLTDSYGLNITCYQISLAQDLNEGKEYLAAIQLFPPRELASQARRRGALKSEESSKFAEIEELLQDCSNEAILSFYTARLGDRRNKKRDSLVFPQIGQMRFRVRPYKDYARVNQLGRFEGDVARWQNHLSKPAMTVKANYIKFYLETDPDVQTFMTFCSDELANVAWTRSNAAEDDADPDEE